MESSDTQRPLACSVGVMAYNEERNIGRLLQGLTDQQLSFCRLDQVIVVASGCTDRTEEIVEAAARRDPRVRLVRQNRREGKARAINLYLKEALAGGFDVCVLQSGDTLPEPGTLDALISPMALDASVGMVGAHVVPVNSDATLLGGIVQTLWRLHHRLALVQPKAGEMVAFRNVVDRIPEDSAVDEVSIEAAVRARGLSLRYAPDAIVRNKGPETVADFIRQRRRIHAGHLAVVRGSGYAPSTMSLPRVARHFAADLWGHPSRLASCLGAAALEATGRALGSWDHYVARRSHAVWEIAVTTKNVSES